MSHEETAEEQAAEIIELCAEVKRLRAERDRFQKIVHAVSPVLDPSCLGMDAEGFGDAAYALLNEVERRRASQAEIKTAWLKTGEELIRWQRRAQEQDSALRQAEERLAKVVGALKPAKQSIEAIMQGRTAIAAIALSGVGDDIDAALAAAQIEEKG